MTEPEYGYPDFIIKGSPDEIRNRTGIMRDRASDFETLGDSLRSVSTDGWVGRAADRSTSASSRTGQVEQSRQRFPQSSRGPGFLRGQPRLGTGRRADLQTEFRRGQCPDGAGQGRV